MEVYKYSLIKIYDPIAARMMNADPFIANPNSAQDYNRYSYVRNNPLKYTDPSGYWPRWLRLGWRKNVPMFTSSDYSAAAPSQLGIDDYESPSNNADDGSGWLWIYRDSYYSLTGISSHRHGNSQGGAPYTYNRERTADFIEPSVLDLLNTYHKSYLNFRQQYHNQHVNNFNNLNINQISEYLYSNSYLEPDIEIAKETGLYQIAEINYIIVTSQNGYVELGNFVVDENTEHEYYPYFSYSATNPYSRFWYGNIVIITHDGYYEIFIQWWVPFSL
jgi:hypothetical protein